jgi:Zn-dependent M28 family amino/carboxypeptidase
MDSNKYLAAGTTGAELLFQATSNEMIDAYSRIPRPMGTVVAADVFKTGIMLSEYVCNSFFV